MCQKTPKTKHTKRVKRRDEEAWGRKNARSTFLLLPMPFALKKIFWGGPSNKEESVHKSGETTHVLGTQM